MVPRIRKTDGGNDRLRTKAGGPRIRCANCPCVDTDCCDNDFPAILNCAVDFFGSCTDDVDITLRWDAVEDAWLGSHTYDDGLGNGTTTMTVTFYCDGTDHTKLFLKYVLPADCDAPGEYAAQITAQACSPLSCSYAEEEDPIGCNSCASVAGTGINFVVTEKA